MPSIAQNINASELDAMTKRELLALIVALRADVIAVHTRLTGVLAKLDADAGVTDVDYSSLWPAPASTAMNTTL